MHPFILFYYYLYVYLLTIKQSNYSYHIHPVIDGDGTARDGATVKHGGGAVDVGTGNDGTVSDVYL